MKYVLLLKICILCNILNCQIITLFLHLKKKQNDIILNNLFDIEVRILKKKNNNNNGDFA